MKTCTLVLLTSALFMMALSACDSSGDKADSTATAPPTYKPTPPAPKPAEPPKPPVAPVKAPGAPATQPGNTQVVIETNMGDIVVELDDDRTPITVKNFLQYADDKSYDNTIFHRVISGFMIQGGGFDLQRTQKATRPSIVNEVRSGRSNARGTIAMARTDAGLNTATNQFFINHADNKRLDTAGGGYCAFGRVVEGMDVVDRIAAVPTRDLGGPFANIPVEDVVIKSIRRK